MRCKEKNNVILAGKFACDVSVGVAKIIHLAEKVN